MTEPMATTAAAGGHPRRGGALPGVAWCWGCAVLSALVVLMTLWMALQPGAANAQAAVVRWVNDPPDRFGTVLALTNALLRPVPLIAVALSLLGWITAT